MRLVHRDFQFELEMKETGRSLIVAESPEVFRQFAGDFQEGCNGNESGFVLSEDDRPLKMNHAMCCVVNPYALSVNERKLQTALLERLQMEIERSDLLTAYYNVNSAIEGFVLQVLQQADWELEYSEKIDLQSFLKFTGVKFAQNQETLLEAIVEYIKISSDLLGVRCFVFVHLLSYLNAYEVEKLYEMAQYWKVSVLLLESVAPENMRDYSSVIIVDKDCCEIAPDV